MKIKLPLLSLSILCIAACTHTPSDGEKMLDRSEQARKLSNQWTQGEKNIIESKKLENKRKKLIHSGNNKIAKGKKLISNGEHDVSKGNKMLELSQAKLESGQRLQQESNAQFIEQYPGN